MSAIKFSWILLILAMKLDFYVAAVPTADINQYIEDSVSSFKLQLHKASQQRKRRVKRTISLNDFTANNENVAFEAQIQNITPWQSIPTLHPVELEPFTIKDKQYVAVVNFMNKLNQHMTKSAIYVMNDTVNQFQLLQEFSTSGGIDFEYADLGTDKYAIFLDHVGQNWYGGGSTYEKWFQLQQFLPTQSLEKPFQYRTKVRALGAKSVKVFTKHTKHFFVTANSYYEVGDRYHVKSTMHVQTPFGYELVQTFETQGAQDVEVIVIDGVRYILFVNHVDNSGNVDIYSAIFREKATQQLGEPPFDLYQRIATHGGRDFEYFTFDNHHYLAVANEYTQINVFDAQTSIYALIKDYKIDSVIYWWTGKMWVEWQRIPTNGAVKWAFFTSDDGSPMLVVSNSKSQAVIFTYDPLRGFFKPTDVQGLSPFPTNQALVPDVRSVLPFKTGNATYLAVANYNVTADNGYNVFKLSFTKKPVPKLDPSVPELIAALLSTMAEELELIKRTLLAVLLQVTEGVMTKSTDQNITSNIYFKNISIHDTLSTGNLLYLDNVTVNPTEESERKAVLLKSLIEQQESKILALQARLDDAVKTNEAVVITAKKTFIENVLVAGTLSTDITSIAGLVDKTNITDLQNRHWSKDTEQTVTGHYVFDKNVLIVKNLQVDGLVNGKNMNNLLTTNTEQTVTGKKLFQENLHLSNNVSLTNFTLNTYRFPGDFVTTDGHDGITGFKNFNHVIFNDELQVNGLLDDVDVTTFYHNKMTVSTDQAISTFIEFDAGFTVDSDIRVDGFVDSINITAFYQDITLAGKTQVISGSKRFKHITVKGHVKADNLNGFNTSNAMTIATDQTVLSNMTFDNDVTVSGQITTTSTIDGLDLSEDVVLLGSAQSIGGYKTIESVTTNFNSTLSISGLVDAVNLQQWQQLAVLENSTIPITGKKTFIGGVNISENLQVATINNIYLPALKNNLISLTANETTNIQFQFENVVVEKNLVTTGTINNYNIPVDFVTLTTNQTIRGIKTFVNNTQVNKVLHSPATINGENLDEFLENVVKKGANESIHGDIIFNGNVYLLQNATVDGKVNNLTIPDDVVTLTTQQNISGVLTMLHDTTFEEDLNTYIVHVNTTVNHIDISMMEKSAVRKDRNQTINGSIIFLSGIECKQNLSVAGLINGVNLTELYNNTVRISKDQQVYGKKEFIEDVMFENTIISPGLVTGVNLTNLNENVMRKSGNQTVTSRFIFNNYIHIKNLRTSNESLINSVNFHTFLNGAVKVGETNTINGSIRYKFLQVTNLTTQLIDGIDLTNVLLARRNQSIQGNVNFSSIITKNVHVPGLVDGVNLTQLNLDIVKQNRNQSLTGHYTFQRNVMVNDNVNVHGDINGVNLTDYDNSAVHLTGDETITGVKSFENITFKNVNFLGLVSGVNMTLLTDDTLLKTGNQTVCQVKTFEGAVTVNSSKTNVNDVTANGLINNVNTTMLTQTAVRLNQYQKMRGTYHFEDGLEIGTNLTLSGLLNGFSTKNFMNTFGDQNITGYMTFRNISIEGHLNVTSLVDEVDVGKLDATRVSLNSDQIVYGNCQFLNAAIKNDIKFPDGATINGIDISSSLVHVNDTVIIGGHKIFKNVHVKKDATCSSGVVNGINLRQLDQISWKTENVGEQIFSMNQSFTENFTIYGHLNVKGLINGINVVQVGNYSTLVSDTIQENLIQLTEQAAYLCSSTMKLLPVSETGKILSGFEKVDVQSFLTENLGSIHSTLIGTDVLISVARAPGSGCGPAYILICTQHMQCSVLQTILTNAPTMEFFNYNNFTALFIAHWKADLNNTSNFCNGDPEIYVWRQTLFEPYQTLNQNLMEAELAPVLQSSAIMSAYLGKAYRKYQISRTNDTVNPFEELPVTIEFFKQQNKNFLAVGGSEEGTDFIDVLFVNGTNVNSIVREKRIKIKAGAMKHVSIGQLKNEGKSIMSVSTGESINLYASNDKSTDFKFYQKLPVQATKSKLKSIGKKSYLSFVSPAKGFGLCQWQGVSGFTNCKSLQFTDTRNVEAVITSVGAYSVAGTENKLIILKTIFDGNDDSYTNDVC